MDMQNLENVNKKQAGLGGVGKMGKGGQKLQISSFKMNKLCIV